MSMSDTTEGRYRQVESSDFSDDFESEASLDHDEEAEDLSPIQATDEHDFIKKNDVKLEEENKELQELRKEVQDRRQEVAQKDREIEEKDREIVLLKQKTKALEERTTRAKFVALDGDSANLSAEDLEELKREVAQQNNLLRGYQHENEVAMKRIKALEQQLARAESAAIEAASRAERTVAAFKDEAAAHNGDSAARLAHLLKLEAELEGLKESQAIRETELKAQIERLRSEKKELEGKAGGIDVRQMQEGDVLVRKVRQEMEIMRDEHIRMLDELQNKLRWYAENQELVNKNDALINEQAAVINRLEERLLQYEGTGGRGRQARMKELEEQVASLTAALRARHPNSLPAVIQAAKPSIEENTLVVMLKAKNEALAAAIKRKDDEFETQLRAIQQQYEKVKLQFEERQQKTESVNRSKGRIKELEKQVEELRAHYTKKLRAMELKMQDAELTRKSEMPSAPSSSNSQQNGAPAVNHAGAARAFGAHPDPHAGPRVPPRANNILEQQLRVKDEEISGLKEQLAGFAEEVANLHVQLERSHGRADKLERDLIFQRAGRSQDGNRLVDGDERGPFIPPPSAAPSQGDDGASFRVVPVGRSQPAAAPTRVEQKLAQDSSREEEVRWLRERCSALEAEGMSLRLSLQETKQKLAQGMEARAGSAVGSVDLATLQRRLDASELALATVQRAHTEAIERGAKQTADHQRALVQLHDEVAYKEGMRQQEKVAQLEQSLRASQQRCQQLEEELATSRARANWAPEAMEFVKLERRLDEMEREQAAREVHWRSVVEDTRHILGMQLEMSRKKWELAFHAKDQELQQCKMELERSNQVAIREQENFAPNFQQAYFANMPEQPFNRELYMKNMYEDGRVPVYHKVP